MKKLLLISAVALCMAAPSFGARYRVSDAGIVAYENTGAAIASGDIVDLGYRYGIAAGDIASNTTKSVFTDGIWNLKRADTNAIALGANVYVDSASNVTGTAGAGGYIGQCIEAVAVCTSLTDSLGRVDKFVKVDIGAPQKQIIVGTDTEAWDADLDILAAGLANSKLWIGSSAGAPAQKLFSGLFTNDSDGVATATTTGSAVTGVATTVATVLSGVSVATEIDCLDSITPTTAAALTGLGSPTTVNAVTAYAAPQTADAITTLGTPTTANAVTGYDSTTTKSVVTNITLQYSGTLYDSTGAALTNAAGIEVSIVTNMLVEYGDVLASLGSPTTWAAITGFGAHTTAAAVTNLGAATVSACVTAYGSPTTADFINAITSNVVQAAKTLGTTTDSVIDSVTPTTATFVQP